MNTCKECNNTPPEFTEKVLEIINPEQPVLFHRVDFPASMGDDTQVLPDTLDYKNVLLYYEANNHAYLYSSDGVPTLISMGQIETEQIEEALKALGIKVQTLQENLAQESATRAEADATLQTQAEAMQTTLAANTKLLDDYGETDVVKNVTVSTTSPSTVTMRVRTGFIKGVDDDYISGKPFPVASTEQAGVMNAATFKAVQDNSTNIDSILGGAVALENLPAEPTQEALTNAWQTATEQTQLINRASIMDITNQKMWYYYTNVNEWYSVNNVPEVTVATATNDSLGIVKGGDTVFVEPDGSLTVVGLDEIKSDITNIQNELDSNPIPKLYDSYSTATDGANTAGFIKNKLDNQWVELGLLSKSTYRYGVAIGQNAAVTFSGDFAHGSVAIGKSAKTSGYYGIAIGENSNASKTGSVALGYSAATTRNYEVSFGNTIDTDGTRFLANVKAGALPTDAVNLQQMQDYVAEHGGGDNLKEYTLSADSLEQLFYQLPTANSVVIRGNVVLQSDAEGGANLALTTLTAATTEKAGVMVASDKAKLEGLANITSIGDNLTLDEDGVLSATGGSSVLLYPNYSTATDGANTANFINTKLNSSQIAIGYSAQTPGSGGRSIAIGNEAKAYSSQNNYGVWNSIAIGSQVQANTSGSNSTPIVIGQNSKSYLSSIVIGSRVQTSSSATTSSYVVGNGPATVGTTSATLPNAACGIGSITTSSGNYTAFLGSMPALGAGIDYTVALGHNAVPTRKGEANIGTGTVNNGYNGTNTRILGGVHAGELPTDAVNVAQLNAAIGDIEAVLQNLNTGTGV